MQLSSGSSALNGGSSRDSSGSPRISAIQDTQRTDARIESNSLEEMRQQYLALHNKLDALLAERKAPHPNPGRLAIRNVGRILFIDIAELQWIEAADNYLKLHTTENVHLLRDTMQCFEQRLPAGQFVRINRSAMVNLRRVKALEPLSHGEYTEILEN